MKENSHEKTNTVWIYLDELSTVLKFIKTESRMVVTSGCREGELFNRYRVSSLQDEKVLEMFHNNVTVLHTTELYA